MTLTHMLALAAILGALCLTFIGVAVRAAIKARSLGTRTLWILLVLAIVFAATFYIVQKWESQRGDIPELVATTAAYFLVALAGIAFLRGLVSVAYPHNTTKRRIATSVGVLAAVLLILIGAYFTRMSARMSREGWWAGAPVWLLVQQRSNLPPEALGSVYDKDLSWSLLARDLRKELSADQHDLLIDELKNRFHTKPSPELLKTLNQIVGDSDSLDPLAIILFEGAFNQFCDTMNAEERRTAAWILHDYLPTNGKIYHPHIGAAEGPRVSNGRVPRLVELTHDPDFVIWTTAVDMLAVSGGDDARTALPRLLEIARGSGESDRFTALWTCEYLAHHAPSVRQLLVVMLDSPDLFEQLFAIEALSQWNWSDPTIVAHLQRLSSSLHPEVAEAARRAMPLELR